MSYVALWTVAHQASLSIGLSRQEYWNGLPVPSPGNLPSPGIEPKSPALAGRFFTASASWESGKDAGGGGLVAKSCLTLATPWTVARQASWSMGFSRQEYKSGLPFPFPGDLPNSGIKPGSPAL